MIQISRQPRNQAEANIPMWWVASDQGQSASMSFADAEAYAAELESEGGQDVILQYTDPYEVS